MSENQVKRVHMHNQIINIHPSKLLSMYKESNKIGVKSKRCPLEDISNIGALEYEVSKPKEPSAQRSGAFSNRPGSSASNKFKNIPVQNKVQVLTD